ncbi:hypothetical protein [Aequorivita antarctica]|uniref:Uncharacterized protein n=1 Tax=Aequorivita antarctica TaxID=153266 RepID=A0A5C6Z1Z0_9FLAO|nr:hypothetical protein [Aequorivita antarctica]TXD73509.1 hypothetical protein ESU54_07030 [Aequorivita antarctica]SRX75697.1 hypothetical protein AEQU3_02693 [Aequorivita antarctica]
MKIKIYLIALFSLLLVFSTSTVLAFGNSSKTYYTVSHFCSNQGTHPEKESCCDNDRNNDNGCSGLCNNNYCYFSSWIVIPSYIKDTDQVNTTYVYVLKVNHNYVQNTLKKVYLSIWQPPEFY